MFPLMLTVLSRDYHRVGAGSKEEVASVVAEMGCLLFGLAKPLI